MSYIMNKIKSVYMQSHILIAQWDVKPCAPQFASINQRFLSEVIIALNVFNNV